MIPRHGIALAAVWSAIACSSDGGGPSPWVDANGYRWRELTVRGGDPRFTSLSPSASGIDFTNSVGDSLLLGNRILGQGAGVALGDVDGDGLTDIFLGRTEGCNALYRNRGGWKFDEIAARAGVAACDRFTTGAAFVDVDGVNGLDLVMLATRGPNAVFLNDGTGRFTERRDLGVDTTGKGGTTIAMADVEGDGDLDLYVANYNAYNVDDSIPPQQRAFNQMVRQTGPNRYEIVPEHRDHYRLVMRPDMGGLRMSQRGATDDFYRNEGGRFVKEPFGAGRFRGADGASTAEAESFTLAARFADLDRDGAPDLYVANDFEDVDELWYNDGSGNFRRASWQSLRQMSNSAMGVDVGDVNGDTLPDLFVVDMLSNEPRRLKTQIPTHTALPKQPGDVESQLQQQRNTLYLNRGDGTFAEASFAAGVQASGWSWATMLLDVDLDGWQDILITNGHLWDIMDADTHERLQNRLTGIDWRRLRWEFPRLPLRNIAYRNRGGGSFEDASREWNFGTEEDISHAIASGDLDNDGDPDVVINRLGSPALVLRNETGAGRVAVRLVGDAPNTAAVGARVRLLSGGSAPVQEREVFVGGLYLAHSDYKLSFALTRDDTATIEVRWRDGRRSVIGGVRANREYEIRQAGATASIDRARDSATTLFEDATRQLGGHRHSEAAYDDWEDQFLLPNALSQLGPGVAWFDLDRDGDEDLVVGSGRGGSPAIFRSDGRSLSRGASVATAPGDITGIVGIADATGARVLAGISSWEIRAGAPAASVMSIGAGGGMQMFVPGAAASPGPLALADYDGDGDLDLFVGGRAVPAAYPRSAASTFLRNDGGRFVVDSVNTATVDRVGLVSGAVFSDIDGDGDADLVLAREWDSLLLLRNDRGRFVRSSVPSLERWTSRWNGVATGDLDGDGRLDIVATSWGDNTMMQADSARPLVMLHGGFGSAGEEEMIVARSATAGGPLVPLNSFPRARVAIPDLGDRIRSFGSYADATAEQVLGPASGRVTRREVVTLHHMIFLNRADGFVARPLPREAQLAPAFHVSVADFDGDGREDVFMTQNFYPTAVGIPRYDSGRGLLLRGDGAGGLTEIPGQRSGIVVYGDQRGAAHADFDRDGRLDLVISQNAAETRLLRNRGARQGLRVRLAGSAYNPDAIGATVRLVYTSKSGPVREVQAGSGYWSQNGAVQVLGTEEAPTAVRVRWPDGRETSVPVRAGEREIVVRFPPR